MKQLDKWLGILLVAMLLLTACGGDDEAPTPTSAVQPTLAAGAQPAPAAAQPAAPKGDATKGKQLFIATCAACHGPTGEGVKGLGKDMTHSEFIAGLSDADLMAFIKKGRPIDDPLNTTGVIMPPYGGNPTLSDTQLMDIVAFIRAIHQ